MRTCALIIAAIVIGCTGDDAATTRTSGGSGGAAGAGGSGGGSATSSATSTNSGPATSTGSTSTTTTSTTSLTGTTGSGGGGGAGGGAGNGGAGNGGAGLGGGSLDGGAGSAGRGGTGGGGNSGRPIVMGYVQTLRSGGVADVAALDYSAVDVVVHAFLSPGADGSITQLDPFDMYRQAGLPAKVHAAGGKIIFSIGGSNHSGAFSGIAANAATRKTFADNIVKLMGQYGYDGVDLDYEFPASDGDKANHLLLMQDVRAQVKAANASNIVVFGVPPGYFLPYFAWSSLGAASDYAFYFCYDWDADGAPMTNPGKTFMLPNGQTIERSCRGAMNFMIMNGYPPEKIIVGMPFYGSNGASWFSVRDQWAAAHWPVDPNQMQAQVGGAWWTSPEALALKIDAVLDPSKTVLVGSSGKVVAGGVGFWEWGHEAPAHPDLSGAIKAKLK